MGWPKGKPRGSKPPSSGRKPGVPNKNTQELRNLILEALHDGPNGGLAYLVAQRDSNPTAFMALIGKVLPMAVTGADGQGPLVIEIVKFRSED